MLTQEEIPLLGQAAHHVGGWAIRNMGTVGGNLFAPPPSGDFAVALLALDAQVKLVRVDGERVLPLADFYTGFMTTALAPGELVTEIRVPVPEGLAVYAKVGRRQAQDRVAPTGRELQQRSEYERPFVHSGMGKNHARMGATDG